MIFPELLNQELSRQRESFAVFDNQWRTDKDYYGQQLQRITAARAVSIRELLQAKGATETAWPADELEKHGAITKSFGIGWPTHEAARRWALEILRDRVTCAADGSQLIPGREVSLPIALVQVAWFENAHNDAGDYRKEARPRIIAPAELLAEGEGRATPEAIIGTRRFVMEVEALCEFMERQQDWQTRGARRPVAFFDGSFAYMLAFAGARTQVQDRYEDAIRHLLRLSQETQIPVVGYIDQSYSRDLVKMVDALNPTLESSQGRYPYDAQLLPPLLKNWGDRTIFCYYRAAGWDAAQPDDGVGFVYLQTSAEGATARLELPAWVYRAGCLDDVLDTVRAECICGLGYPYAIETADQAAVITSRDRDIFLRAVQEFAREGGFSFRVARKLASKMRRR